MSDGAPLIKPPYLLQVISIQTWPDILPTERELRPRYPEEFPSDCIVFHHLMGSLAVRDDLEGKARVALKEIAELHNVTVNIEEK